MSGNNRSLARIALTSDDLRRGPDRVDSDLCVWSIDAIASRSPQQLRDDLHESKTSFTSQQVAVTSYSFLPSLERDLSHKDFVKDLGVWPNPRRPRTGVHGRLAPSPPSLAKMPALSWEPLRQLQIQRQKELEAHEKKVGAEQPVAVSQLVSIKKRLRRTALSCTLKNLCSADVLSSSPANRRPSPVRPVEELSQRQQKHKDPPKPWDKVYFWSKSNDKCARSRSSCCITTQYTKLDLPSREDSDIVRTDSKPMIPRTSVRSDLDEEWTSEFHGGNAPLTRQIRLVRPESPPPSARLIEPVSVGAVPRENEVALLDELVLSDVEAFHKYSESGYLVFGQNFCDALASMGYEFVFHDRLQETTFALTSGRLALDLEDFCQVAGSYINQHLERLEAAFARKVGPPGSSKIAPSQLPGIFAEVGIPLMPGSEVDLPTQSLDFRDFLKFYHQVSRRAGLTMAEYKRILERSPQVLRDEEGVAWKDVLNAFGFHDTLIGLAGGRTVLEAIITRVGTRAAKGVLTLDMDMDITTPPELDPFLSLSPKDSPPKDHDSLGHCATTSNTRQSCKRFRRTVFFTAARIAHEFFGKGLLTITTAFGFDLGLAPIPQKVLVPILEECGFIQATFDGVVPFIDECGFKDRPLLKFGEVYTIVMQFCMTNGLTPADLRDIGDAFRDFDNDGNNYLEASELGPLIRWFGYQPTVHRVYHFAEELGVNEGSSFDCKEFQEVVGKLYKLNLWAPWIRYYGAKRKCNTAPPVLPINELGKMLKSVGYDPTPEEVMHLTKIAGGPHTEITFEDFKELELQHRQRVRACRAKNGGLTDSEVATFTKDFERFDYSKEGFIGHKQMRELLVELFPDRISNKEWNTLLAQKFKDIDPHGTGRFELQQYLRLRQSIVDALDRDVLLEGLRLRDELGYSVQEIKQFRDLYAACDADMSGALDFEEVVQIMSALVDMSDMSVEMELREHYDQIDDGDDELTFYEFLQLVHRLQKLNWRHINQVKKE